MTSATRLYPKDRISKTISVIDTRINTVIDTILVGEGATSFGIAFNPYNRDIYVANFIRNTVSVIDTRTNTVIDTIPTRGVSPLGIAFNRNTIHSISM